MTFQSMLPVAILASSIAALAAPHDDATLAAYPKNLARQHQGANVFLYDASREEFATTEAAAAWLDDDVTTGWPLMAGKQYYLLALPEPDVVTNFAISTQPAEGTITLYAGDEPAAPGASSWTALTTATSIEQVNNRKLGQGFNRFAKYILIETDIAEPGPLYSLYLYGRRPATSYALTRRAQPLDAKAIFGFVNDQTAISHSGLYAGARVNSASDGNFTSWQKAIDENPETGVAVAPATDAAGLTIGFDGNPSISRIAVLIGSPARGTLDFFLVPESPIGGVEAQAPSLTGLAPAASLALDGSSIRGSVDFAATEAGRLLVRWTPEAGAEPLALREINAFNGLSLGEYAIGMTPEAVAQREERAEDVSKDGKTFLADGRDGKNYKEELPPIGERTSRAPYLPGALGFPPVITTLVPPPGSPPPPLSPVSP